MKTRIITGICLAIAVVTFFFIGDAFYILQFGLSILGFMGAKEMLGIFTDNNLNDYYDKKLSYLCLFTVTIMPWLSVFAIARVLFMVSILLVLFFFIISKKNTLYNFTYILLIILFLGISLTSFSMFYLQNRYYFFYFLLAAFATDTAAYFSGYSFGKNKLIPWVSPKKTVEGAVGGAIGAVAIIALFQLLYMNFFSEPIPQPIDVINFPFKAIPLTICLSICSMCGDLFFSKIKRHFDVKDFSDLLPGHGGVMDRIDSVVFVTSIYLFITFLIYTIV